MMFDPQTLKYDANGLLPVIAQCVENGDVLMLAWMNSDAVTKSLETRKVTYWSRSRKSFWVKGETSGHTQALVDLRYDCDQDCLLAIVLQEGPACHTKRRSCFYTSVIMGSPRELSKPTL
ncbi:MAG: phosphoribosyl-AMP cyclohydrolase [Planktomarina sp.]|nr:phosphoribosyl-AMP cyclohydrolase [Planktomarina sp.]